MAIKKVETDRVTGSIDLTKSTPVKIKIYGDEWGLTVGEAQDLRDVLVLLVGPDPLWGMDGPSS
jgi:hypothetical protein